MTALVVAVIVLFLGMSAVAFVRPERIVATVGTTELTRDGRNEVRAVYGGFGLAVALLLGASFVLPTMRAGILISVAASIFGMAAGRIVSVAVDGAPGFYPWLFLVGEVAMTVALVAAVVVA